MKAKTCEKCGEHYMEWERHYCDTEPEVPREKGRMCEHCGNEMHLVNKLWQCDYCNFLP